MLTHEFRTELRQVTDQGVGDVVPIDLVTRQEEGGRTPLQIPSVVGDGAIGERERIRPSAVQEATRAVEDAQVP
ncbi:MAG: hypothetical protein M3526_03655, partial [Actinomycetota bacterium]|nr:hypothetical protein [Actinomycetota bacterium]